VTTALALALQQPPAPHLVVALSGGRDSVSLLHALVGQRLQSVTAVHVHHGLQAAADRFAAHCEALCAAWNVPLQVRRVTVTPSGQGLEADARRARYAALAEAVPTAAVLVTAHHAGDQAETVLMRVLRGTGPEGLAGMRAQGKTVNGTSVWRPWLAITPQQIAAYAQAHGLQWIDDPHNDDPAFTRVWLRQRLLPEIETRYPAAQAALGRLAELMSERAFAPVALSERPTDWGRCWPLDEAARLTESDRREALRTWLRGCLGQVPSAAMLARVEREVVQAGPGRHPVLRIRGVILRRHRQGLYATHDLLPLRPCVWADTASVDLPGWGRFTADSAPAAPLTVRASYSGERIKPRGSAQHQRISTLMHARGVPAWLRGRVPVLAQGDEVVALADWRLGEQAPAGLRWRPARGWTGSKGDGQ
jgi:tRNA(Ile)-lysidine synthase